VSDDAEFIMNGGTITGNTAASASDGNDICVWESLPDRGRFSWTGGTIPNAASSIKLWDGTTTFDFSGWSISADWRGGYYPPGPTPHVDFFPVWSGDGGTATTVKAITTAAELAGITTGTPAYFALAADITVPYSWTAIGNDLQSFQGIFDGRSHTITFRNGMEANSGAAEYVGLFGLMEPGATVENVTIAGDFTCSNNNPAVNLYVGGIAGKVHGGTIENCAVKSTIVVTKGGTSGTAYVGGIAGQNNATSAADTISACAYTGGSITVIGASSSVSVYLGGITGYLQGSNGAVVNCYSTGNLIHSGSGAASKIGGIVGVIASTVDSIKNCYALGSITGITTSQGLGGIVGDNTASISAIIGCVALNSGIYHGASVGRVAGENTVALTGPVYGLDTMQRTTGSWTSAVDGKDGATVTLAATQAANGYWWFDPSGLLWSSTVWRWGNGYPVLSWE
jgi:hypothetical protein